MVIILNGASSSGKSSLAKAMQHVGSEKKFLTLGLDTFIKMMPYGMLGFGDLAKQGFSFEYEKTEPNPSIKIMAGGFAKKLLLGISKTSRVLAELGFNVIIDEVILEKDTMKNYISELAEQEVFFVKVTCDLKLLQEREVLRGNRSWGLAYYQYHNMHDADFLYDITIDTSSGSIFEAAQKIIDFTTNPTHPTAMEKMLKIFSAQV